MNKLYLVLRVLWRLLWVIPLALVLLLAAALVFIMYGTRDAKDFIAQCW